MRLVAKTGPGQVELSYMWMPTFLGLDALLMKQIEEKLMPELVGKELTEDVLDVAHDRALDIICELRPLPGLRDYLDALKFVEG